jgi:hypothetical protein
MGPFRRRYKVTHLGLRMLRLSVPFGRLRDKCIQRMIGDIFTDFSGNEQPSPLADTPIHTHKRRQICYQHDEAPALFSKISKTAPDFVSWLKAAILNTFCKHSCALFHCNIV